MVTDDDRPGWAEKWHIRVNTDRLYWVAGWLTSRAAVAADPYVLKDFYDLNTESNIEISGFPFNLPGLGALEEKSDTFKESVERADAVLGVVGKLVAIAGGIAGLMGGSG